MSSNAVIAENRAALLRLLRKLGLKPRRENGQNFLLDGDVAEELVTAGQIAPGEQVLEIGPGLGAVTDLLLERQAKIITVELDDKLAPYLKKKYADQPKITVIQGDVMKLALSELVEDRQYTLVSSLPYNITSLVLRNFLELPPRPRRIALLVQKEVAERVCAPPGAMSILAASVQYLGVPNLVSIIPRTSFYPEPEVDGAIIKVELRPPPSEPERQQFFRIVRIGFSARRKTLVNNLQNGLGLSRKKILTILENLGLSPLVRAQELRIDQWVEISKKFV